MSMVRWTAWGGVLAAAIGCTAPVAEGTPDAGSTPAPLCTAPTAIPCEDRAIQDLNLQKPVAPGEVQNDSAEGVWTSTVDATAGGFNANPPHSYVYAKFTGDGLAKVDVGDEDALASMDWDIAFRRFVVRINSGDSGPSCVSAQRLPDGQAFEDVTSASEELPWRTDDEFSDACELVDDGSGLPSSPGTALSGYYSYKSCVKMSGKVYALKLKDARTVKLTITQYYGTGQDKCDSGTGMGSNGGVMKLRWAFLP